MSTSQGLGIIGAAVGFFVGGGPAGAQWGYAIGSTVGSIIDPKVIKGPDLGDAKQQTSQAGIPIVKVYGMPAPFAGTIIDGDPVSRKYTKREKQGKGGPVVESQGFRATRAILVGEGEIDYARIWRNGKLVYSTIAGDNIDADSANFASQLRLYRGTDTQLPDPALEAIHGVGNTPYYRGRAYIVVIDDDETQSGGAANQYLFQVTDCADITPITGATLLVTGEGATASDPFAAYTGDPASWTTIPATTMTTRFGIPRYANGRWIVAMRSAASWAADIAGAWTTATTPNKGGTASLCKYANGVVIAAGTASADVMLMRSLDSGASWAQLTGWSLGTYNIDGLAAGAGWWVTLYGVNAAAYSDDNGDTWHSWPIPAGTSYDSYSLEFGGGVFAAGFRTGAVDGTSAIYTRAPGTAAWELKQTIPATVGGMKYDASHGRWVAILHDGSILISDDNWASYATALTTLPAFGSSTVANYPIAYNGVHWVTAQGGVNDDIYYATDPTGAWSGPVNTGVGKIYGLSSSFSGFDGYAIPDAPAYYVDTDGNMDGPGREALTSCGAVWSEIALDIASRTACPTSKLDVANMTDTVPGFILARADLSGNDYLRALCGPYFTSLPEYDGQLHAIRFGGASVATITADDLLEIEDDDDDTRKQTIEAPARVTIAYPDPANNYVVTPQTARRSVPDIQSTGEKTVQTVIPFSADQAAQIADKMQKVDWTRVQGGFTRALVAKWSKLVPSDAITWTDGQRYIVDEARYEDSMITIKCSHDRISDYASSVSGANAPPPAGQASNIKGPSILAVMNLPSLKSADNEPGVYLAVQGLLDGWPGADIYLSVDGGVTEQLVMTITDQAVLGELAIACDADGADSTGLLNVQVYVGGELESITDAQVAARQNGFVLSTGGVDEIGQFKDATETSTPRNYDLTNVTRGELGTTAASHAAGDRFVLLDGAVKFLAIAYEHKGKTLIARAVTRGTVPANNDTVSFVFDPATIVYTGGDSTT